MIAPTFDVIGIAAPQGSKTAIPGKAGHRPWMIEGGSKTGREKHKTWRQAVMVAAQEWLIDHPQPPIDEPITLIILFRMERTKAAVYRTRHTTTPDQSKLIRSTEDSLKEAQLIRDDSLIWSHVVTKRYVLPGELPGCTLAIELNGADEDADREVMKQQAAAARKIVKVAPQAVGMLPL